MLPNTTIIIGDSNKGMVIESVEDIIFKHMYINTLCPKIV
jgi:hypothetical protein